jgi:hypothetical protein
MLRQELDCSAQAKGQLVHLASGDRIKNERGTIGLRVRTVKKLCKILHCLIFSYYSSHIRYMTQNFI